MHLSACEFLCLRVGRFLVIGNRLVESLLIGLVVTERARHTIAANKTFHRTRWDIHILKSIQMYVNRNGKDEENTQGKGYNYTHHGAYIVVRTSWCVHHGAYIMVRTSWCVHHGAYIMVRTQTTLVDVYQKYADKFNTL